MKLKKKKGYVSLGLLSFERPEFLMQTLDSIEKTADYPYELIIHDDGSDSYNVREIVIDESSHGGIASTVILNQPGHNQGQGVSLNRIFNIASGDYIFKLDADLKFESGWLSKTVKIMEENQDIGLLGLLHYEHDPVDSEKTIIEQHDEWSQHTHILGSAFCVRRETWEELGPFTEHSDAFAEDWEFQKKVHSFSGWKVALPKESLCENHGMGIGTSTIVLSDGTPTGHTIKTIHKTPFLLGS